MSSNVGSAKKDKLVGDLVVNIALGLLVLLWTIPTIGLLVSSFRDQFDIATTGWWTIFPHREWVTIETIDPPEVERDQPIEVKGVDGFLC